MSYLEVRSRNAYGCRAAGLGAAIDYLSNIGMNEIRNHEIELTDYALGKLTSEFGETISILAPKTQQSVGA